MKHSHKFTRIVVTILLIPVFLATTVGNLAWAGPIQNAQDALNAYKDLVPAGTRGVGMFSEAINCFALALELTRIELGDPSGDLETFTDKCRFDIGGVNTADANGAIQQGLVNLTGALIWALAENLRRHKEPKKPLPGSIE
jgi:hypothetical protein